ncbi:MAG: L-seryl-tRNA(Sec) selenium transferase [Chloroflexi bacterium]|nr:MAG: L-seryl-tRNA(Sec) selenium transferase [Chloroflexota bacterium]MBL1195243.1 L-seryl-tRNA(Sec) selenium transferase [Chloroflexota bacterium]NOH12529.1 L-seryl-tRNA(Sec) selenium transferase [Chloroflexota bacterium]
MTETYLRNLPSIDKLLHTQEAAELIAQYGRPLALEAIREVLGEVRSEYLDRPEATIPAPDQLLNSAHERLKDWAFPTLLPVINASGVIVHTNLGRAPLSRAAVHAMQGVSQGYSNLEYDVIKGQRGSRYEHAEELLKKLTGAEAALVVNNNAAALLLILAALSKRRRVLISRTQLIEIGGGFRIPEIMKQSGAILEEIGATNRVHLEDYAKAIDEHPIKLILRAHRSNFRLEGFTGEPTLTELATLARKAKIPLVDDLGSGTLLDTSRFGLDYEPTVQDALHAGVDLVCFSGDKLLGGPQAGIIVGKWKFVSKLKKHPLARALRSDKMSYAALSATLMHYLVDEAEREVPVWRMISTSAELLKARAEKWRQKLGQGEVVEGESTVGGGSLPGETMPTYLLALDVKRADQVFAHLRQQHPPIIVRLQNDRMLLDPRTVLPEQEGALLVGLQNVLSQQ